MVLTRAQPDSRSLSLARALCSSSLPPSVSLVFAEKERERASESARGRRAGGRTRGVACVWNVANFLQCDDAGDEWVVASCRSGARVWERACGRNTTSRWSRCPELPKRSDDRWKNAGDATTAAPRTVRLVVVAAAAAAPRAARDRARCVATCDLHSYGLLKRAAVPSSRVYECLDALGQALAVRSRVVCTCVRLGVPAHNLKARTLRSKVSGRSRASSRRCSRLREHEGK